MNTRVPLYVILVLGFGLVLTSGAVNSQSQGPQIPNEPQGNVFTYQGRLTTGGNSTNGLCDFQFSLWNAESGPIQVGDTITKTTTVSNGLFTAALDFGSNAFTGETRWLEIAVRCPTGSGIYTTLGRQAITAAPYALYSLEANHALEADNAINSDTLDGHQATDFELPANVLYVFSSNSTTNGNAGGRSGMNAICTASDPASHFCNRIELENAYSSTGVYIVSTFTAAWLDNVHLSYATNPSQVRWELNTCTNWTNSTSGDIGFLMTSTSPAVYPCTNILPVACCKWVP